MRIVFILPLVLFLSGAPSPEVTAEGRPSPVEVEMIPIDLDETRPERKNFGSLQLLAALQLRSTDRRFGGLSGLSFGSDGRLYAVSDRGYWVSAETRMDADGLLVNLQDWQIAPMLTISKGAVSGILRDAEALARTKDGSFLVGFEGAHRVWRYAAPPETLTSAPTPVRTPAAIARAPRNGGIEAVAELADGRLILLTEDLKKADGSVLGWLRAHGRWEEISYLPADGFNVTDCAALPNGDLLVLERRFAFLAILSARLTLVAGTAIRAGTKLVGEELLRLEPPLAAENFEGIAVRRSSRGMTVFMISDDNYSSFQQTLLLQFLAPAAAARALTSPAIP